MFTGIVEEVGEVADIRQSDDVVVLTVRGHRVADVAHGDSIAVNGCCLTAVDPERTGAADGLIRLELVPETLKRTSLGNVTAGSTVNLERAVPAGGRLDGHIVQGHVDGIATLVSREPGERSDELRFSLPAELSRYVVEKGSIAVDGVSLTVAAVYPDGFGVALIPTTLADTTLGVRRPGDTVNLEVDVIAKYVERMTAGYLHDRAQSATDGPGAGSGQEGAGR
ncbi:riboflavin synthase alpha chain [Pseudonocardia sediminis]|uniref:Riboflavin synthase n=1 Tax=Pseudonocardia sediminis TaxID=1397368 RepID=A0A4V2FQV8_PSEST|nr:riboflavin synthase [Pseudonocardia sediminis]RZT86210.1 riboflavin synthase alpha chain [Pseudonocardia sediminis]